MSFFIVKAFYYIPKGFNLKCKYKYFIGIQDRRSNFYIRTRLQNTISRGCIDEY